jgi:choloylglycine hydrolase
VPFGAPYKTPGTVYNTEYRTVCDCTDRRYFFELTTAPNVVWADLTRFDLTRGAQAMVLDPDDIDLAGDVTNEFRPLDPVWF